MNLQEQLDQVHSLATTAIASPHRHRQAIRTARYACEFVRQILLHIEKGEPFTLPIERLDPSRRIRSLKRPMVTVKITKPELYDAFELAKTMLDAMSISAAFRPPDHLRLPDPSQNGI